MKTPIAHVVFDVGRVLIEWDMENAWRDLIPDPARRRWFMDNVCTPAWNAEQDRGRPWAQAEAALVKIHPEHETPIRAFRTNWRLTVPGANDGTVAILRQLLADGRDVTLLTNFAADTFAEARQRFAFLGETRGATVSGEVGHIKPEAAIFGIHARAFALDPRATLFIDDSAANVTAAIAAGWQGLRFVDSERLRRDLTGLGLLTR
jgi:2-haloacid dehalogenase